VEVRAIWVKNQLRNRNRLYSIFITVTATT
jgi:hypothetical protein